LLSSITSLVRADDPPPSNAKRDDPALKAVAKLLDETAIQAVGLPDARQRFVVLTTVARCQAKTGSTAAAIANARKASTLARSPAIVNHCASLIVTSRILAEAGDLEGRRQDVEEALRQASALPPGDDRIQAWGLVAEELTELGDRGKSIEVADWVVKETTSLPAGPRRGIALANACSVKAAVGDLEGALNLALKSSEGDKTLRSTLLSRLCFGIGIPFSDRPSLPLFLSAYEKDAPLSLLKPRTRRIVALPEREARQAMLLKIGTLFDEDPQLIPSARLSLVRPLADLDDIEDALKNASPILDAPPGPKQAGLDATLALIEIAKAQARLGRINDALATFRRAEDYLEKHQEITSETRKLAIIYLAPALAETGHFSQANQLLSKLTDTKRSPAMLIRFADFQEKAGDHARAKRTLDLALRQAEEMVDHPEPGNTPLSRISFDVSIYCIAEIRARRGDYAEAESALEKIQEKGTRRLAAYKIALARTRNGDIAGATNWAATIEDVMLRLNALDGLVESLASKNS
jgi:tetratricopeptide (TPR) repeat protein